ncbi:hypothetical protein VP01_100g3 [Puccinia sorghi]|uniref:Uncharacterized protein n=1 Tax=Puccinia sorghi TaxID=27349 RepID=A0A0L6VVE6_9BASI|nr:hypothetical protein VP01_100g3 [Puccinia sorghi]
MSLMKTHFFTNITTPAVIMPHLSFLSFVVDNVCCSLLASSLSCLYPLLIVVCSVVSGVSYLCEDPGKPPWRGTGLGIYIWGGRGRGFDLGRKITSETFVWLGSELPFYLAHFFFSFFLSLLPWKQQHQKSTLFFSSLQSPSSPSVIHHHWHHMSYCWVQSIMPGVRSAYITKIVPDRHNPCLLNSAPAHAVDNALIKNSSPLVLSSTQKYGLIHIRLSFYNMLHILIHNMINFGCFFRLPHPFCLQPTHHTFTPSHPVKQISRLLSLFFYTYIDSKSIRSISNPTLNNKPKIKNKYNKGKRKIAAHKKRRRRTKKTPQQGHPSHQQTHPKTPQTCSPTVNINQIMSENIPQAFTSTRVCMYRFLRLTHPSVFFRMLYITLPEFTFQILMKYPQCGATLGPVSNLYISFLPSKVLQTARRNMRKGVVPNLMTLMTHQCSYTIRPLDQPPLNPFSKSLLAVDLSFLYQPKITTYTPSKMMKIIKLSARQGNNLKFNLSSETSEKQCQNIISNVHSHSDDKHQTSQDFLFFLCHQNLPSFNQLLYKIKNACSHPPQQVPPPSSCESIFPPELPKGLPLKNIDIADTCEAGFFVLVLYPMDIPITPLVKKVSSNKLYSCKLKTMTIMTCKKTIMEAIILKKLTLNTHLTLGKMIDTTMHKIETYNLPYGNESSQVGQHYEEESDKLHYMAMLIDEHPLCNYLFFLVFFFHCFFFYFYVTECPSPMCVEYPLVSLQKTARLVSIFLNPQ